MKNNKGFAISIMLYAMVLLIVTIFYIILAIVKNRYNVSEELVDTAVAFMDKNDYYASGVDKTPPIIVFDHNSMAFNNSLTMKIYIYDEANGSGIDLSGISLKNIKSSGTSTISTTNKCNKMDDITDLDAYLCTLTFDSSLYLSVSATDNNGNTTNELRRITRPSSGPKCNDIKLTGDKLTKLSDDTYSLLQGDYATYEITCSSENGIDAFFNNDDFISTLTDALIDFNVTTERGYNSVIIKIKVRANKLTPANPTRIKFSDSVNDIIEITDSIGMSSGNIELPYIYVRQPDITN